MPKSSNLTPSQAAAVLTISGSTLRRWSTDYTRHLSETARGEGGRHRTYTPADVATLKRAGELLKTHAPIEVDNLLGLNDEAQQSAALATLPTIAAELQAARALVHQLGDRVAALETDRAALAGQVDDLNKAHADQAADLADLRAQLADLKTPRHWWQRLRGG
jgi:DNA-binding transcriptional MerR regulator